MCPQPDDIQNLGGTEMDSGSEDDQEGHPIMAESIKDNEEALRHPSSGSPSPAEYDYVADCVTPFVQAVGFDKVYTRFAMCTPLPVCVLASSSGTAFCEGVSRFDRSWTARLTL